MKKERINENIFFNESDNLKIQNGWYSDIYFNRTKEILEQDNRCYPKVMMQIFQKNKAVVGGIDEAIAALKNGSGFFHNEHFMKCWKDLEINALYDGDDVEPFETIMSIEGDYSLFAHLETLYLGILSRRTKISTNVRKVIDVANGKPILFFSARFDHPSNQSGDGYAAYQSGVTGVSTDAQTAWLNSKALGTIPHGLIAAYNGNTVKATIKFTEWAEKQKEKIDVISLVDFDNDCVKNSLAVAHALGKKLWGVRLDTSGSVVDKSLWNEMYHFDPRGVNSQLVRNVRNALDDEGFDFVKIVVSGGFNPQKIKRFEKENVPVDVYAVGSYFFEGNFDYTADIVQVNDKPCSKVGRKYNPNERLELVK